MITVAMLPKKWRPLTVDVTEWTEFRRATTVRKTDKPPSGRLGMSLPSRLSRSYKGR